jgi:hypothetical protein
MEPWVLHGHALQHSLALQETRECINGMQKLLQVCVLLRQHATLEEVNLFLRAAFFASPARMFASCDSRAVWGRRIPGFTAALGQLLH